MTIEDEIFDDMEARYMDGNYYKGDMLKDMAFLFAYVHMLRGEIKRIPRKKEVLKEPELVETETPPNVKDALKRDLK